MKNKHPVLRRFMRRKVSVVAAAVLILFVLIAILGPLVWQVDPLKQSVMKKYGPMTVQHPLGTDNLGRDTLARMIYGARVSLAISFAGVLSGALIGVLLGVSAGYFGGWVDAIISRFIDILLAFPGLLLAITIVAVLGPGSVNTVIAITIFTIPGLTRMVRSVVLSLKSSEYVEACKTMGERYDFIVKATDAYLGTLRSMPDITCYSMQTGMINLVWNKHSTDKYLRLAFQALANADDLNTANYGSLYDNDPCFMEKSQPGWYTTKGEEFFCQNDPEKAKELLAQSSFDTSKPLRILTATGGGAEAMLEVLRQEAAKIGVTLEITATDRTTMTSMRNDETLYDAYFTTFSSVAVPSLRNFLSADYAGWSDDEHLQELMLQMTTAATKEAAFATWEEIQYYCYSDYCPILMMGHFHQAAACTNRLTGYNVFLTTNFWNAKLAK